MNPEDIKVGETYYARVKVDSMDVDAAWCLLIDESGKGNRVQKFYKWMLYAFSPIPTPKYDPCRKFREGDIARPRMVDGRKEFHFNDGDILKVYRDEDDFNRVSVENQDGVCICTNALFLELVTPVEERVSFRVGDFSTDGEICVWKDGFGKTEKICSFNVNAHPHAKEAAEAECARLNAEYRKERK